MDFLVTLNRRVHWLMEAKASDSDVGARLAYYTRKLQPRESLQLVLCLDVPTDEPADLLAADQDEELARLFKSTAVSELHLPGRRTDRKSTRLNSSH